MTGIKKLASISKCLKKSYPSLCPTFFALLITVSERHCFTNFYVRGIAKNGILLPTSQISTCAGSLKNGNSQIQYSILVLKLTWSENELFFYFWDRRAYYLKTIVSTELLVIFKIQICITRYDYIRSFKRYINVIINFRKLRLPFFLCVSSFLLTAPSAR